MLASIVFAAPAWAQQQGEAKAEPPLDVRADNVSGSHGPEGDILILNGNLRFVRGRTLLFADAGRYLRTQGLLFLDGRVRMVDSTTTITCDHARFDQDNDLLQVDGNVVIHDRDAVMNAPSGVYDRRLGRVELTGPVKGRDRDQRLESDRAIYWRDSMLVQARGDVHGYDDANRVELDADSVDFDRRTREASAVGRPVLKSKDDQGHVTELRARRLHLNTDTRVAEALDSVTVASDTLRASSDYALFDDRAQRGVLLGHPRMWDDQTNVTGDTVEVWTDRRVLKRVTVRHDAVMDYKGSRPTTLGEASRLTGDRVDVFFTHRDIDSLVAIGQARDDYAAAPQAGKTQERNLALGDTITVFFKDRKIQVARVEGSAKGEFHPAVAVGDTSAEKKELVAYDAVRIEYVVPKSRIVLDRGAHLTYRDLELRARRVEYDVDGQTLVAEGKPELKERGDQVQGQLMSYDLGTRVGTIYEAQTAYERGLYHGEAIRKVGENELDVLHGAYSTCDLPEPHYHFASRWMKIYLKDKLVAKPVVFYIENVPVLALPFYVFPIKPGRHSGFLFPQVEFGVNNAAGQFIRNAGYYWAPNDYMDLTLDGDYYQAEPSWVMRLDGEYKLMYVLDGSFQSSFARNEATKHDDWDFYGNHNQDLGPNTHLVARAQFVSSRDYATSDLFGAPLSQRVNRFLTSNLSIQQNLDWASLNAYVDRRQDLDADAAIADPDGQGPLHGPPVGTVAGLTNLTETTPSVSISFPQRTLGSLSMFKGTPWEKSLASAYTSLNARFVQEHDRRAFVQSYVPFLRPDSTIDSTTTLGQQTSTRRGFEADGQFSDFRRVFGWLTVAPGLTGNAVVFDFDELGHKVVPAAVWSSHLTTGATFYGTFAPHIGPLIGLRHIVAPSVSFSYAPEFGGLTFRDSSGTLRNRFNGFGGIGISGFRQSLMSFSLDQRLQLKLKHGDQVQRLDNLLSWTTSGSYDYLWREHGALHPLSTLGSTMALSPPGVMNANMSWTTDVYQRRPVRSLTGNVGVNLGSGGHRSNTPALPLESQSQATSGTESESEFKDVWTMQFAYSYAGGITGDQWSDRQYANMVASYKFSPGWSVDWSGAYDITFHTLTTQRFSITRDLHCWSAIFTRTFSANGEAEYYFRIGIKEQKEIYLERGTRAQSIGGIQ